MDLLTEYMSYLTAQYHDGQPIQENPISFSSTPLLYTDGIYGYDDKYVIIWAGNKFELRKRCYGCREYPLYCVCQG